MMRSSYCCFGIVAVFVASGCEEAEPRAGTVDSLLSTRRETQQECGKILEDFAKEHGADAHWPSKLSENIDDPAKAFTFEMQRALVGTGPVAIFARLVDISDDGTGPEAIFSQSIMDLRLKLTSSQLRTLLESPRSSGFLTASFAVVAEFKGVSRREPCIDDEDQIDRILSFKDPSVWTGTGTALAIKSVSYKCGGQASTRGDDK